MYPDIYNYADRKCNARFQRGEAKDIVGNDNLGEREKQQMHNTGSRTGKPPERIYRVVECVGAPELGFVHGTVYPVKTEISDNHTQSYLDHRGEQTQIVEISCGRKVQGAKTVQQEDLPHFSGDDDYDQSHNVEREVTLSIYRMSRAPAFQNIEEQNYYNKRYGLINLVNIPHIS